MINNRNSIAIDPHEDTPFYCKFVFGWCLKKQNRLWCALVTETSHASFPNERNKGQRFMANVSALTQWVTEQLEQHPHIRVHTPMELTPLIGDAGLRQYFSVKTQPPLLAVMAPPHQEISASAHYFASLAQTLRAEGMPVPDVIACDNARNFLLIEHFIGGNLYDHLSANSVDALYAQALLVLLRWQQIPRHNIAVPDYSATQLHQEMTLFREWFVETLLQYALSSQENRLIDSLFDFLVDQALSQPQVLVHRDFHSRNLICRDHQPPGVIDFQDAVWGPITYDPVSLLRDGYIRWPSAKVRQWLSAYGNMAYESGLLPATSQDQWFHWFDTMGLQRHLKVLGIFARLSLRDNKHRYLNDLPLVIRYVLSISQQYPATQHFAHWFEQRLLPLIRQQPWYASDAQRGERPE